MRRLLLARACAVAVAVFATAATLPAKGRPDAGDEFRLSPHPTQEISLPAGFTAAVDRATQDQFVGVVAGDVDHDGDLDVVASLESLDLAIWRNDGAGHFTRLPSSRHSTFQTQLPAPSVDSDLSESHESIQNGDPRGADLESRRVRTSADPETPLTAPAAAGARSFDPHARPSRAPPLV